VRTEAERLPFADNSFDLVFGHAVLHHLPDLTRRSVKFRRVLKPGGVLLFAASRRTTATACELPEQRGAPRRAGVAAAFASGGASISHAPEEAAEHSLDTSSTSTPSRPADPAGLRRARRLRIRRVSGEELVAGWFGWRTGRSSRR